MRVYLDNCCYNRPFDDQNQLKIAIETAAKLAIQAQMRSGALEYAWSDGLDVEVGDCRILDRQEKILPWRDGATVHVSITSEIESRAMELTRLGVKSADALHLACAESAGCDWFFTTDRVILKKVRNIGSMRVANPTAYIQEDMM